MAIYFLIQSVFYKENHWNAMFSFLIGQIYKTFIIQLGSTTMSLTSFMDCVNPLEHSTPAPHASYPL